MGHSIRIGRVFGIDLRVDTSWLVILVLMLWSLPRVFFAWHPEWSPLTVLIVALVASLTFFASVLLHELAHSLVARAYGVPVRDVTLHMFGGVSNIEREPPTPNAELLIAIVGPLASIVLGLVLTFVAAAAISVLGPNLDDAADAETAVSRLGPIATILLWLGPINILVGVFNLIPGFPLDGGRVLRALVWKVTGDLGRSTRIAALVGQAVGWCFVLLGIVMAFGYSVPFFGAGLGSGLWLALIGLFLRSMAVAHYTGAAVSQALAGVRVRDLMRREGPWVAADVSVRRLVDEYFLVRDERALPVFDGPRFVGLVCFQDVRRLPPEEWETRAAADIMTPQERLTSTTPDEAVEHTLRKLAASDVRQLPVLYEGGLAGMLFESDVIRWLELASARSEHRYSRRPVVAGAR
jgi:Zn-dependent protease/CBS domain-containing protein